jgi:hypothetical protein
MLRNRKGYITYPAVLQLAFKFKVGHKILKDASTSQYRFLRNLEAGMIAERLMNDYVASRKITKSEKSSKPNKKNSKDLNPESRCVMNASIIDVDPTDLIINRRNFNIVKTVMRLKVALMAWRE